jgi:hypothetical protein
MMDSKYYAPTIEEFHVGFGYEIHRGYSEKEDRGGVIEMSNKFVNTIMTNETGFGYIQGCIDDKFLRVKYLDQEDIESLGFKFSKKDSLGILRSTYISDPDSIVGRILDQRDGSTMCWHMKINCFENNVVKIECQMSDANEYTFFEGTIKNKSELKKVLKMIGYELPLE